MGDEHLSTFCAEEIVPIPREYEDTSRSDSKNVLPSCDDFSSINVPQTSSARILMIPTLMSQLLLVTPLSDSNKDGCLTPGDDIEFLLHHDPSKSVASILKGFIDDPLFEENDDLFDLNIPKRPPPMTSRKEILYDACNCWRADVSIRGEEGYFDSEGDVLYLKSLLSDDTTHNIFLDVFFDHEPQQNEPENESLITFSPKSDPLHHEFTGELIMIPSGIVREHEDYINRMSLLCGNSSSRLPENSHTVIESLPTSTTLIEDSDSNREEIDIFSGPDDSIPPVINNVDELNEDECFDPGGGEINVEVDNSFKFVTWTFVQYSLLARTYGYSKNHKKTVKTGQTRTRERKENTRAGRMLSKNYTSSKALIGGNPHKQRHVDCEKAHKDVRFYTESFPKEAQWL
ncbi:hypothetical protein Tco_1162705 [Tanacetum coccineum]